jgi:hypothetical protein
METVQELQAEYNRIVNAPWPYGDKAAIKARKQKLRELEAKTAAQLPLKVGDFFYESWGYDQTNIDYLEVMEISPTRKTALCRMVGKHRDYAERTATSDKVTPDNSYRGPMLFRMRISAFRDSLTLRGSYPLSENYYLRCKLADQHQKEGSFKCPKYDNPNNDYELSNYFLWSQMAKENRCKDCKECHKELGVSWREGSFSKYEHPMYETALGFGH